MKVQEVLAKQARKGKTWILGGMRGKREKERGWEAGRERKREGVRERERGKERERETLRSQTPVSFHFYPLKGRCFGVGRGEMGARGSRTYR